MNQWRPLLHYPKSALGYPQTSLLVQIIGGETHNGCIGGVAGIVTEYALSASLAVELEDRDMLDEMLRSLSTSEPRFIQVKEVQLASVRVDGLLPETSRDSYSAVFCQKSRMWLLTQ